MTNLTADRARALLGGTGKLNGHDILNGHDVLAGHASRRGTLLITQPRHFWPRLFGEQGQRATREKRPGASLIGAGGVLLFLLGSGLLAVSFAAQYQYVLHERHQHIASLIEAGALDVGLIIFSLLALGLARGGLSAKVERAAVLACAAGSAVMNYAAADVTSPRSVLAYCMPPVFLAFVVDRVVRTIQRHVLGMSESRSPWAALTDAAARLLRLLGMAALYVLRFLVDRRNTCKGLRQAILNATPLPSAATSAADERQPRSKWFCFAQLDPAYPELRCDRPVPCAEHPRAAEPHRTRKRRRGQQGSSPTKTARFLELVQKRHGELAAIPLDQVSRIATTLAPEAELHPASARTALLGAVRAALPAGEGDDK